MATNLFLVRNGATLFEEQGRLLGRRDLAITAAGKEHAAAALETLREIPIHELLSSPLGRAIQTAEVFAQHLGVGIGRDPRLTDVDVGRWEGAFLADLRADREYQDYLAGDLLRFPEGEELDAVRRRGVASVEQAAADNPRGANLVLVTHRTLIQLILAHYLEMPTGAATRLRIDHGSISILRFASDSDPPEILGVNLAVPLARRLG